MSAGNVTLEYNKRYNVESNFSNIDDENDILYVGFPPRPPRSRLPPLYEFQKCSYHITIAFGLIGNSLIFHIFTRTKLKKASTSRYLAAAAMADTGFLFTSLFFILDTYNNLAIFSTIGPCQLIQFRNNVFMFLSTWYLTSVMIEKYIGVSWPRKRSRLCTMLRAKCVIIALAVLSLVCYLYITLFFGVVHFKKNGNYNEHALAGSWYSERVDHTYADGCNCKFRDSLHHYINHVVPYRLPHLAV